MRRFSSEKSYGLDCREMFSREEVHGKKRRLIGRCGKLHYPGSIAPGKMSMRTPEHAMLSTASSSLETASVKISCLPAPYAVYTALRS